MSCRKFTILGLSCFFSLFGPSIFTEKSRKRTSCMMPRAPGLEGAEMLTPDTKVHETINEKNSDIPTVPTVPPKPFSRYQNS